MTVHDSNPFTLLGTGCPLVLLIVFVGCSIPKQIEVSHNGAPCYDRLEIVYELYGAHAAPASEPQQEVGLVNLSSLDQTNLAECGWSIAHLQIQYPHPDGTAGQARARLRISRTPSALVPENRSVVEKIRSGFQRIRLVAYKRFSAQSAQNAFDIQFPRPQAHSGLAGLGFESRPTTEKQPQNGSCHPDDEIWILDLPKQELDRLLVNLSDSGFFDQQLRPAGGASLVVRIDRRRTEKAWTPDPHLDEVVARVYREGMLEGFVSSSASGVSRASGSF